MKHNVDSETIVLKFQWAKLAPIIKSQVALFRVLNYRTPENIFGITNSILMGLKFL